MRASIARFIFPVLAAVLAAGTFATAQGPGDMGMGRGFADHRPPFEQSLGDMGRWWNNPRMIQTLKLTDDQRKAMDQILYQHREKLIDLQANLERSELAMQPLMSADQPDQAAITAQIDKVVSARADLEKANALFLLDIRMKLTPDQWKQLKDMRSHRMDRGRMMDHHGMMGQGGPGGPQGQMWRQRRNNGQGGPPPAGNPPPAGGAPAQPQQPQQQ